MRSIISYPRTLIVGAHFSEQSGSGTYLGRLFSGWPLEALATVAVECGTLDWRRCRRHYRIGGRELRLSPPFRRLVRTTASGPILPCETVVPLTAAAPTRVALGRRLGQYPWRAFLRLLGGGEVLYSVAPSPELLDWANAFHPEAIYGQFSSLNSLRFLRRFQQALKLPLVLHFMDDFPEAYYRDGVAARCLRPRYLQEFEVLVGSASAAIAICQEMAEEYEQRYRRSVLSLPMPVELGDHRATARTQWTAGHPFRVRYGGRLGWAIRESLADLARAIRTLRGDGAEIELDIATFQPENVPAACIGGAGVEVRVPGPLAEAPRVQAEADVLAICYDFDPQSFRQARYSMPAKMADCMASGTPILVYAPAGLPVVEYARREGWGKIVDRRDPQVLLSALRELMSSATLREQLGRRARSLAVGRHDAAVVSDNLRNLLASAATRQP